MDSKIKELLSKLSASDKRVKIFIAVGIIGMLLILLSELIPGGDSKSTVKNTQEETTYYTYIENLEEETQDLVSSIDGAGKCKVMITLKNTNESVFAKNTEENKDGSSYSKNYEYVLYDGQDGETPVLIQQYFPQIQGVAIVCDGADNTVVRENIINSVSSLFNISSSKISVSKLKQ